MVLAAWVGTLSTGVAPARTRAACAAGVVICAAAFRSPHSMPSRALKYFSQPPPLRWVASEPILMTRLGSHGHVNTTSTRSSLRRL
eukprot:5027748-Prymnesium_polylepis.1